MASPVWILYGPMGAEWIFLLLGRIYAVFLLQFLIFWQLKQTYWFLKQHFRDNKPASLAKIALIYQMVQEQAGRDGHMDKRDTIDTLFWNPNEKDTVLWFFLFFFFLFINLFSSRLQMLFLGVHFIQITKVVGTYFLPVKAVPYYNQVPTPVSFDRLNKLYALNLSV